MDCKQKFFFIFILCISLCLVQRSSAAKYDKLFDRPTHYPGFKPPVTSPNNMTYFVRAKTKSNTLLCNYEIAVYDEQNNMRATGRSISSQRELCTLTIRGEQGEKLHFEIIYGDFEHPMIIPAEEMAVFEINDVQGDIDNPFYLTFTAPTVKYWNNDVQGTANGIVEITEGMPDLKDALRVELSDNWTGCGLCNLFSNCNSLLYVSFLSMPETTTEDFNSANPNCLKFLPPAVDTAPEGWTNCISADNKALTDIHLTDGSPEMPHDYYCPADISLNGYQAAFSRSGNWLYANGKGGWNTLLLPFDAILEADGTEVAPLPTLNLGTDSEETKDLWKKSGGYWACSFASFTDNALTFSEPLSSTEHIKANTPYLFAVPNHQFKRDIDGFTYSLDMENKTIVFVNTTDVLPATPQLLCGMANAEAAHCMLGTFSNLRKKEMYLLSNNYTAEGKDAFVYAAAGNLLPFRAYVSCPEAATSAPKALMVHIESDNSTDIRDLLVEDVQNHSIYDLSGKKRSSSLYYPQTGIVIKDKKKMMNVTHGIKQ